MKWLKKNSSPLSIPLWAKCQTPCGRGDKEAAKITSMQQGRLAAGYRSLWSTLRKLSWSIGVAGGRIPSGTGYDGDGQNSSKRRLKLLRKRGRGGGHGETWFGMDGRGVSSEEAAGK